MRWKNHHKPLSILSIWWIMAIAKTWFHLLSADDLFAPSHVVALLTSPSSLLVVIMLRNQPGLRFRCCSSFICHFNWKWSTVQNKTKRKEKNNEKNVSCNFKCLAWRMRFDRLKHFICLLCRFWLPSITVCNL